MRPAVRSIVLGILGWVSVVGVLGSLTFVVVDLADQVVGGRPSALAESSQRSSGSSGTSSETEADVLRPGEPAPSADDAPGSPRTADPRPPTDTDPGTATPAPTAPAGTEAPTATGPRPTAPQDPPSATVPPTPPVPSGPPAPEPLPQAEVFPGDGGTVVASCRGRRITLVSITVRDGWAFAKDAPARSSRAVVTFSRLVDHAVVTLEVECVGGAPKKTGGSQGRTPGSVHATEVPTTPPVPAGAERAPDATD